MVGFDLARTFHPSDRLGRATGVVNIGGFTASLVTIALIGVVLDQLRARRASRLHARRLPPRDVGAVPLLGHRHRASSVRYRRKSLRHIEATTPAALDALRRGDTLLPGISRDPDP